MTLLETLRKVATHAPRAPAEPSAVRRLRRVELEKIRYPGEAEAAARLRKIKGFKKTLHEVDLNQTLRSVRQATLDQALRLDEQAAPALFAALDEVRSQLGFRGTIEAYQDLGDINATMTSTEHGAMLTLAGPVLEIMSPEELRGLLGHELAHYVCHSGPDARFRPETRVALEWRSRYEDTEDERAQVLAANALSVAQEITADRFEVLICQDLDTYLRTSLKFSTELHDTVIHHDPQVLLRQSREALAGSVGNVNRRASHPERHLRVRAAELFCESDLFCQLTGRGDGQRSITEVNEEVARLLVGWVPRGADTLDQLSFERFLLASARAIIGADGVFRLEERRYLARALPSAWHGHLLSPRESEQLVEKFADELRQRQDRRALLTTLNFLCGAAEADGRVTPEELRAIDVLGRALDARELFRHELRARFQFDPAHARVDERAEADEVMRSTDLRLLRYLDTVVLAGRRRTTIDRLLHLGGYGSDDAAHRKKLATVLDASGLTSSPSVREAQRKTPLWLAREDLTAAPASRAR